MVLAVRHTPHGSSVGKSQGIEMRSSMRCRSVVTIVLALLSLGVEHVASQDTGGAFQMTRRGPGLSLHKEMFMLPVTFSEKYHSARTEAVFQVSAKYRLFNTPVYFAYTQISFWQAYDHNHSAPFRETNYNPELFWRTKWFPFRGGLAGADIGFEHESNGQRPPLSRSWNLLYVCPYYQRDNLLLYLKFRYRVPEDEKETPDASVGDDNPDITDYLGYTDVHLFYKFPWRHTVHFTVRGSVSKGRGGVVCLYSIPVPKGDMSFFAIRISHGYGESLVDYKESLTRVGIGIMFAR